MSIKYKADILARLKAAGYSTKRLREEKVFGEKTIQDFRRQAVIPYKTLDKLCALLGCGVEDIIEYTDDGSADPQE